MRAYEIRSEGGVDALVLAERDEPKPGPGQVLMRVRASSINYRDLSTIEDPVSRKLPYPRVPNSDGAGDVVEVGEGVTRWRPGDRVCGTFFQGWFDGPISARDMSNALGGTLDGMLSEYRVLSADGVVAIPSHLSFEEAATLPCSAVTAWNSLVEVGRARPGDTVLLLGTGGVSIVALQIVRLLGARAIVTSSSAEKLERARALGAWQGINYRETPEWDQAVLALTDGRGADHTVEVGGAGTIARSVNSTRLAGSIGMIGVLTGGSFDPTSVMRRSIRLQGIYVGSRRTFEDMNRAIEQHKMKPVVDQVFEMEHARDAYHAMRAARHFGKLVVRL